MISRRVFLERQGAGNMEASREHYGPEFYRMQSVGSRRSAEIILGLLFRDFDHIGSVVDVGCGVGTWLAVCRELGCEAIVGADWHAMASTELHIDARDILQVNLEQGIKFNRRFDLCLSLEVAEHLSRERAASFVEDLCALSDLVLFSAAVPGQAGTNHVNEQWHSYWASLFDRNGYGCFDLIRSRVWHDARVDWWYAQNAYVFVKKEARELFEKAQLARNRLDALVLYDTIHPLCYSNAREKREYWAQYVQRLERELRETRATLAEIVNSECWRYTEFVRIIISSIRRLHMRLSKKIRKSA